MSEPNTKKTTQKATRERQQVESKLAEPWKPEQSGDTLEGTYLGKELVKMKGTKRDPFYSYHFRQDSGEVRRIASSMLNGKMAQIPKGAYCWLTYVGLFETKNGPSADFTVETEKGVQLIDPLNNDE